jgi:UDP-N-acetylmuramoyl-tripeptide--D-alanyl-D-alanine ligase
MGIFKNIIAFILEIEARAILWRYKPKIIAVTGSVGKTTTKDAIFAAVSPFKHVRKSQKSLNGDIGVPLTILGCENAHKNPLMWIANFLKGLYVFLIPHAYPEWLILEVGADKPGDIRNLAKWLCPDIAVLTGMPEVPVHVELFASPEELYQEKRSLVDYLKKDGIVVLNGDDERLRSLKDEFYERARPYGFNMACSFIGWQDEISYDTDLRPVGMSCTALKGDLSVPVFVQGALGRPRLYGALAALAVCDALGIDLPAAAEVLKKWEPPRGRMRILTGVHDSILIDDSYNSSPVAAISAIESLSQLRNVKRKIVIFGDMLELGKYSTDAHRTVGEFAASTVETLITVGFRAKTMADAALEAGMSPARVRSYGFDEAAKAAQELAGELQCGDVVLVKGSQSLRMERASEVLLKDADQAPLVLARQEPEWKRRA